MNAVTQTVPAARPAAANDMFLRRLRVLQANAPAAPDLLLHLVAHMLGNAAVPSTALRALGNAIAATLATIDAPLRGPGSVTPDGLAHAHCQRLCAQLHLTAHRRDVP